MKDNATRDKLRRLRVWVVEYNTVNWGWWKWSAHTTRDGAREAVKLAEKEQLEYNPEAPRARFRVIPYLPENR